MKKILIGCVALAGAALFAAPVPDEGAKAVLKKYAEAGKNYTQRTGRTAIFARSQVKYGLDRAHYLHRWTDRPLWQDTALKKADDGTFINPEAWKIMHRTIQAYGIDGFAFFPMTKNRPYLFKKAGTPGYEMTILPELIKNAPLEKTTPLIDMMLECPQVYRYNGKFVITTYSGVSDPAYWVNLKKVLTEKYGDKFLFLPMHNLPRQLVGNGKKVITAAEVEKTAELIRQWLRSVDGYYYNYPALNDKRYFDAAFTNDVMLPLLQGVLSEPEFKDKLLAWGTKCGHENYYVKGSFTYNCGGTAMLRGSVGAAVAAKADIINLVEWDEENENTHFRPTLANGFSTQRIMRYFSGVARGKLLEAIEGDDISIPDVILSYRRALAAGETVDCEVVNVPGAESKPGNIAVTLNLKDKDGKIVRTFSGTLDRMKLAEVRFKVPVAEVLDSHLLVPELIVDGKAFTGFTPIELRANYNGDNKWYKHPIRDLAKCSADLKVTPLSDGKVRVEGKLVSASPLHQVSLLDSGAEIWMDNTPAEFQETPDRVVIKITTWAKPRVKIAYDGKITIRNAKNLRCDVFGAVIDKRYVTVREDGWDLHGIYPSSFNGRQLIFSLDRASAENAEIEVALGLKAPGFTTRIFDGTLKVKDLIAKNIYAVAGEALSTLIFHHNDQPHTLPPGSGKKEVSFSVIANPALPQSVYFIEALDVNRKSFRSQPVTIYRPSGKKAKFSAYDFGANKPVVVKCDKALLTPQKITISPDHGTAVKNSGGNQLNGMAGSFASLANNMRYFAEGGYGNIALRNYLLKQPGFLVAAPATVKNADGRWVWRFNGKQNVAFPTNSIYPFSGFELKIKIVPAKVRGTQTLISSSHAGFRLFLKKGVPQAEFYRGQLSANPVVRVVGKEKLEVGKPAEITVRFDQKTLKLLVNGVEVGSKACAGYQLYPQALSVGLDADGKGFKGDIAELSIMPL